VLTTLPTRDSHAARAVALLRKRPSISVLSTLAPNIAIALRIGAMLATFGAHVAAAARALDGEVAEA